MDPYRPLLSALGGGLIVGLFSVLTILIQARSQERRDRLRQAAFLALEDYKLRPPLIEAVGAERPPLVASLDYYVGLVAAMERGELGPQTLRKLSQRHDETMEVLRLMSRERAEKA
jgi:hypothetical protein